MRCRRLSIVAMLSSVVMLLGWAETGSLADPCGVVIELKGEYCAGCGGFQFCDCMRPGVPCLNSIYCLQRTTVIYGGFSYFKAATLYCYMERECHSRNGGLCDPRDNPCVVSTKTLWLGTQEGYIWQGGICGIIIFPPPTE